MSPDQLLAVFPNKNVKGKCKKENNIYLKASVSHNILWRKVKEEMV